MKSTVHKTRAFFGAVWLMLLLAASSALAAQGLRVETPTYKVGFYASPCYHIQDEDGKRYGYGYDMMRSIEKHLQATFDYVGYELPYADCFDLLRSGEIDLLTGVKHTTERDAEFAFSVHPAITATTCMNVKAGNTTVVAGDYSTYEGLKIGLLARHTYNDRFIEFTKEKGFSCEIVYYQTPTELTEALIEGEVDALVNSYMRTPDDERIVENFGETPYYIIARKEDQALIDAIDSAIDGLNVETPNWRTELYNQYYGEQGQNNELTAEERALLDELRREHVVIRGIMNPDEAPYSFFEDGEAKGIAPEIFKQTAEILGLDYEIVETSTRARYEQVRAAGGIDIWMDAKADEDQLPYKFTNPYLTTTVSVLYRTGENEHMKHVAVVSDNIDVNRIIAANWPDARVTVLGSLEQCVQMVLSRKADGALLMTYTAQRIAQDDIQNRLRVAIVPGATVGMRMGVSNSDDYRFYGIWEKTLAVVAAQVSAQVVQSHIEGAANVTFIAYLYDHPELLLLFALAVLLILFFVLLYMQSVRSKNEQQRIADELAVALEEAKKANRAKQDFFSKMSHDIRTPLNVVLGMTQIAQKYKDDPQKLGSALNSVTVEGNHLLTLINSILDASQLEHGHVELINAPFNPADSVRDCEEMLLPLAQQKQQTLTVACDAQDEVVVGDANRFAQIVINIVSNAIKYTENGGKIELSLSVQPQGACRFVCRDNGIGMTQEYVEHIFEDYSRAQDSRISGTQGTGLGMSVVKGFTDLMHGKLNVESAPGVGSTFTVEIPFGKASDEQRQAVLDAKRGSELPDPRYVGKRILLAEDNALNAEIAMELLKTVGFEVDWVENGRIAADRVIGAEQGRYLAVFMDMQMPVMGGVEATRAIRAAGRLDVPIIAMTANTFASDRERCKQVGMNGFVTKPISVKNILAALKACGR